MTTSDTMRTTHHLHFQMIDHTLSLCINVNAENIYFGFSTFYNKNLLTHYDSVSLLPIKYYGRFRCRWCNNWFTEQLFIHTELNYYHCTTCKRKQRNIILIGGLFIAGVLILCLR